MVNEPFLPGQEHESLPFAMNQCGTKMGEPYDASIKPTFDSQPTNFDINLEDCQVPDIQGYLLSQPPPAPSLNGDLTTTDWPVFGSSPSFLVETDFSVNSFDDQYPFSSVDGPQVAPPAL